MSIKKLTARVTKLTSTVAALEAALSTAAASAVQMANGTTYNIWTGRAETRAKVQAVLVAQRISDKGIAQYRFSVGEGFDQRFFDCLAAHIVLGTRTNAEGVEVDMLLSQVGGKSPEVLQFELDTAKEELVEAQAKLATEEAKNALVDGQTYTITLPAKKGEVAQQVLAVLLGQTTAGKKVFNFYYGAGVDARTVLRTFADVVVPGSELEAAEALPEPAADAPALVAAAGNLLADVPVLVDAEGQLTDAGVADALAQLGNAAPQLEQPAIV